MAKINYENLSNEELEEVKVTFTPKKCPKCGDLMVCRELGVWGYYCVECMFWWGTYDPYPKVEGKPRSGSKEKTK